MIIKPAKELALLLQKNAIVEIADTDSISRFNGVNKQLYLVSNSNNMFKAGYGPAITDDEFTLTQEEAFKYLSEEIQKLDRVRFYIPPLPRTVTIDHCSLDMNANIIMRIVEYYDIVTDEILTRYDVLIEKIIK